MSGIPFGSLLGMLAEYILLEGITGALAHEGALGFYRGDLVVFLVDSSREDWSQIAGSLGPRVENGTARVLLIGAEEPSCPPGVAALLRPDARIADVSMAIGANFEVLQAHRLADVERARAKQAVHDRDSLLTTSLAMSQERDLQTLLALILTNARQLTESDAGSIYVTERQGSERFLRFKLTQNDSVRFPASELLIPFGHGSIAGAAAAERRIIVIDDVRSIGAHESFGYDPSFDERAGYRTTSMLVVPLISRRDEVLGVVQLINRKRDWSACLTSENMPRLVRSFDRRDQDLVQMLSQQAGFALENAMLYEEIHHLFAGFVRASIDAIESRDPTTSGHSLRVAQYTLSLARQVNIASTTALAMAPFDTQALRELEYASLMHDFGKIGVRERVLVKAKKLYDEQLAVVRLRFENAQLQNRVMALEEALRDPSRATACLGTLADAEKRLDHWLNVVLRANEPSVLPASAASELAAISAFRWTDARGEARSLISPDEQLALEVPRGSLTRSEVAEIRSHVTHSIRFLSRIPWSRDLERVPLIAGAHHERMDGKGYPHGLAGEAIPLPSRIMAVADVYDALTAADRPYKRALGRDEALAILMANGREGHLDPVLVDRFVTKGCFELDVDGGSLIPSKTGPQLR